MLDGWFFNVSPKNFTSTIVIFPKTELIFAMHRRHAIAKGIDGYITEAATHWYTNQRRCAFLCALSNDILVMTNIVVYSTAFFTGKFFSLQGRLIRRRMQICVYIFFDLAHSISQCREILTTLKMGVQPKFGSQPSVEAMQPNLMKNEHSADVGQDDILK